MIDRESLQSTLQLYEDDLPSVLSFDAELEMWQQHWTADRELASQLNTPEKYYLMQIVIYPNISLILCKIFHIFTITVAILF